MADGVGSVVGAWVAIACAHALRREVVFKRADRRGKS
jgi:hypothetical protein